MGCKSSHRGRQIKKGNKWTDATLWIGAIATWSFLQIACSEGGNGGQPEGGDSPDADSGTGGADFGDEPDNDWVRDARNPMVAGDGDEITNLCDPSIAFAEDMFRLWMSCVGQDVNRASVCYAESSNGSDWTEPIVVFEPAAPGAWDDWKVEVPTVIFDKGEADRERRYKMWYGGANSSGPDLTKIGYAYSADGKSWTRVAESESPHGEAGLVLMPGSTIGDAGVVSDPAAVKRGNTFYLWFTSFGARDDLLISMATSTDGVSWKKHSDNPVLEPDQAWESGGPGMITEDVSHPTVLDRDSVFSMWYGSFDSTDNETYTGIGYATSTDGVDWSKRSDNPVFNPATTSPGEEIGISTGPAVVLVDGTYHLYYCAANADDLRVINHATSQ